MHIFGIETDLAINTLQFSKIILHFLSFSVDFKQSRSGRLNGFKMIRVAAICLVFLVGVAISATITKRVPVPAEKLAGFTFLGSRPDEKFPNALNETNYYASAASGIWTQSEDDCKQTFGSRGHLVSIETEQEQLDLNRWLQDRGSGGAVFWTSGLYDIDAEAWKWAGNGDFNFGSYTNWNSSESGGPSNPNGRQRIGLNHQNQFSAFWVSVDDSALQRYVCELHSTNPL